MISMVEEYVWVVGGAVTLGVLEAKWLECSNAKIHHFLSEQYVLALKETSAQVQNPSINVLMVISTRYEHTITSKPPDSPSEFIKSPIR
jgi:hypothetical protein